MKNKKRLVLILHGHKNNFGGVINFYNKLEPFFKQSDFSILRYRVGSNANSFISKFWFVRFVDLLVIYIRFIVLLLSNDIVIIHINPSLNKKSIYRDFLFVKTIKTLKRNIKIIFHIRGWDKQLGENLSKPSLFNKLLLYQLENSDKIIVLSSTFKELLINIVPECSNRLLILPTSASASVFNGISFDKFNKRELILLYLSRTLKQKGLFHTIDAFVKLKNKTSKTISLIIAGDGEDLTKAKKYVSELDLTKQIKFTGYVTGNQKHKILKSAHIFVFPTFYGEGCPNAVLEAMAAGLPVITTSVGCLKDIVINGENGFVVKQQSVDDIIWAVNKLVNNPELMIKMGKKNRERAIKEFDNEVIFKKIEEIYHQVLQ